MKVYLLKVCTRFLISIQTFRSNWTFLQQLPARPWQSPSSLPVIFFTSTSHCKGVHLSRQACKSTSAVFTTILNLRPPNELLYLGRHKASRAHVEVNNLWSKLCDRLYIFFFHFFFHLAIHNNAISLIWQFIVYFYYSFESLPRSILSPPRTNERRKTLSSGVGKGLIWERSWLDVRDIFSIPPRVPMPFWPQLLKSAIKLR